MDQRPSEARLKMRVPKPDFFSSIAGATVESSIATISTSLAAERRTFNSIFLAFP